MGAAIRAGSPPDTALMLGFRSWEVWASTDTLAELEEVLARKKFDRYLDRNARLEFLALIRSRARVVSAVPSDLSDISVGCRDPKHNKFLALALEVDAITIVSSDKDLLVLHPWRGIGIVTPAEFVERG